MTTEDELLAQLTALSGSAWTRLQLRVAQARAAARRPADVMAQHARDTFVRPAAVDQRELSWIDARIFEVVPAAFEAVELSPVVPLGTVSTVARAHQNKVCSAQRQLEVPSDPTNALALIAAQRRRRGGDRVRLCTHHRALRMQRFEGPMSWQHFRLFGAVTAGRDPGGRTFEAETLQEHAQLHLMILDHLTAHGVALGDRRVRLLRDPAHQAWAQLGGATVEALPPDGYYRWARFQIDVRLDDQWVNVADGGFVDWLEGLAASRKERLFISAVGTERLATLRTRSRV